MTEKIIIFVIALALGVLVAYTFMIEGPNQLCEQTATNIAAKQGKITPETSTQCPGIKERVSELSGK